MSAGVYSIILRGEWPNPLTTVREDGKAHPPVKLLTRWVVAESPHAAEKLARAAHPEATGIQRTHHCGPKSYLKGSSVSGAEGSKNITIQIGEFERAFSQPGLLACRPGEVVLR